MNISWSDLNNVQEAGDYPFRDGTITVTFAEVAIWKRNPGAHFQLMRKHPIQGAFRYALGNKSKETWLRPTLSSFTKAATAIRGV